MRKFTLTFIALSIVLCSFLSTRTHAQQSITRFNPIVYKCTKALSTTSGTPTTVATMTTTTGSGITGVVHGQIIVTDGTEGGARAETAVFDVVNFNGSQFTAKSSATGAGNSTSGSISQLWGTFTVSAGVLSIIATPVWTTIVPNSVIGTFLITPTNGELVVCQ